MPLHLQHRPEAVAGYVRTALAIVNDAELSDDLRGIAFAKSLDFLAGQMIALPADMGLPAATAVDPFLFGGRSRRGNAGG